MVLNDIIEQAAGRQSRTSDHGGKLNVEQNSNKKFLSKSSRCSRDEYDVYVSYIILFDSIY